MTNSEKTIHSAKEIELLELLKKVQKILTDALNSLSGKSPATPEIHYLSWTAVFVNRSADGYLHLWKSGRVDASKLLVRPALEATFSGIAAIKQPGFLFRKAYSEWLEDKKLFVNDAAGEVEANRALENLKRTFKEKLPDSPIECKKVNVRDTAEAAGFVNNYEAYKVYCQFTHGAMRIVFGNLNRQTDGVDTKTVIWCVLMILDQLKETTPAQMPDLMPFKEELIPK
jgi:hypothetical protein